MSLITNAAPPPFVVPYCRRCSLPVERYAFKDTLNIHYVTIEAECCGRYQGIRISMQEAMRLKATNDKLFVITQKGRYQGFGELRRYDVPRKEA